MYSGTSAAKALLDYLSNKNTTIQDMFILLHKVELYRGMDILKEYVPEKLHSLIKSGPLMACKPSIQSVPQYSSVQKVKIFFGKIFSTRTSVKPRHHLFLVGILEELR